MRTFTIPAPDLLATHEEAAREIGELRRKGVHCHLEEQSGPTGHRIEVVREAVGAIADESAEDSPRTPR
jgi:hypothetical protein